MQTKFQRDGVKLTWQERWALWASKPKWPRRANSKMMRWWAMLILGIIIAAPILYIAGAIPAYASQSLLCDRSVPELEKTVMHHANNSASLLALLAIGWMFFSLAVGFIYEERKGFLRLIERYEEELAKK